MSTLTASTHLRPGGAPPSAPGGPHAEIDAATRQARRLGALTAVALAALVVAVWRERAGALAEQWMALYGVAYAAGGYSGLVNGWAAVRQRTLDVNILMLIAALGAAAISNWLEGGILLFLFSLSETLQTYALGRTRHAVRALMQLRPDTARLRTSEGTRDVPVEALEVGDVIVVQPGERVPADGIVAAGRSDLDQAAITGESVPVPKASGDEVYAATINGTGVLDVCVTRRATESTVARIVALVAEAQATRAPTQRVIDRFGNRYAWAVILGSLAVMAVPPLAWGWPFETAFYRAMTLLVVASPCALVISTPATYLAAIANAARHRVLFKGGAYLEAAADVDTVAFDKTGTLTHGRPVVTDVHPLGGWETDAVLALAAMAEIRSEHLIGRAVVEAALARGLTVVEPEATRSLPGIGVEAQFDGHRIRVTHPRAWLGAERPGADADVSVLAGLAERLEREAKTVMIVDRDDTPIGVLAVADTLRPAAAPTLRGLRRAGVRRLVMVTGDNTHVARAIAADVGIADGDVHAGLLPADKASLVASLAARGARVAFVGDGVNDAPALAASALGVAMGAGGSDVALETADVVLMGDQIERLGYVFGLGRAARRVVQQNVVFSVGVIAVLVFATLVHGIPLPLGVVGHEGSTVVVVVNGLRLLRFRG